MSAATQLKQPSGASDMAHIVLTFDNNQHASALYGQFDENLARIEEKLGVDIRSKGNQLSIQAPDRQKRWSGRPGTPSGAKALLPAH